MSEDYGFTAPDLHLREREFRAALEFTQHAMGFPAALLEKDYFCSLALAWLFHGGGLGLIFKGGTCLNKVYLDFFRLSEDLDFSIPIAAAASPAQRSRALAPIKKLFSELPARISGCSMLRALAGNNRSRQYIGELNYRSVLSIDPGRLKLEIGLREPLLLSAAQADARTVLLNPFTGKPCLPRIGVRCLCLPEIWAEKVRAVLTRPEPAIRDFFDLWHAHQRQLFTIDSTFLDLAKRKIALSLSPYTGISKERLRILRGQLETDLRPVLTPAAYAAFLYEEAVEIASTIDRALGLKTAGS